MTAIRKRFLLSEEERVGRRKLKRSTGVSKKGYLNGPPSPPREAGFAPHQKPVPFCG
jgi:hypothetical protein